MSLEKYKMKSLADKHKEQVVEKKEAPKKVVKKKK